MQYYNLAVEDSIAEKVLSFLKSFPQEKLHSKSISHKEFNQSTHLNAEITMNLSTQASQPMLSMLQNLKTWLLVAQQHAINQGFNADLWLDARIVVDMFSLKKQVQIACDFAKNTHVRLLQLDNLVFEDTETTLADLILRIEKTINFIERCYGENGNDNWEQQIIEVKAGEHLLKFTGMEYLNKFTLPAFYFHIMTSYNLLRQNGVKLGKFDYYGASLAENIVIN